MDPSDNRTGAGVHSGSADHWSEMAAYWEQVGPPLRPVAQDIGLYSDAIREWVRRRGTPRVLLLGVTPEIYHLPWPAGTDFLAVDRNQAMIEAAWPGPKEAVLCADWLDLALPDGSRDIVLCDGGLHLLAYPHEQRRLARILRGILSYHGLCIFRLYVPPPERESPDVVLTDLMEGRIGNLNVLKLRLGMSLLESSAEGVGLGTVWNAIHEAAPDLELLASSIGWPVEHMLAINSYRDSTSRYHFVTVDEVTDMFCGDPGGFEVRGLRVPSYELGGQCTTIVFRRREDAPVRTAP
jgi:hypothetical protein